MPDGMVADDPLLSEFTVLRHAVMEQMRAVVRLEEALGQVQSAVRQAGADGFKESVAVIRQEVGELAQVVRQQDVTIRRLPDARAIGAAVSSGVTGLAQNYAETQRVVVDAALAGHTAAKLERHAAKEAMEQVNRLHQGWTNDRLQAVLALAVMLLIGVSGGVVGYALRGWLSPPPSGVFARYIDAGNDPDWLLCHGENALPFTAGKDGAACQLKFWLARPGP